MPSKELEAQFESFFIEYEKKREARGWMPLEASHLVHMRNAWFASREAVEIELPEPYSEHRLVSKPERYARSSTLGECREALEALGFKVKP